MVSFELGQEIEKDVFFRLVTSVGERKILSTHKKSNLRPSNLYRSEVRFLIGTQNFFFVPR